MTRMKADFPKGLDYNIGYNPTEFIAQSVSELIKTIYEAMLLVVIVVLVFLQGWRPGDHSDHRHPGVAGRHVSP